MHRRDFLSACGAAGLGFTFPMTTSAKETKDNAPYEGPYYVVFNASGGWDTTYLMDPKGIGGINRLYQEGDILTEGKLNYAPNASHVKEGMSNELFFKKYAKELLVLNGMDYSVNNHSPCSRYVATGKLDSLAYPTFAALVAACKGPEAPLAFLTFGQYSSTGNLVPMARVPYLHSLSQLADADAIQGVTKHRYHDDFVTNRIEEMLKEQQQSRASTPRLPRSKRTQSMLYAAQLNSRALQRVIPYIPKKSPKNRLSQQADIALASFRGGVCVSANLNLAGFDSHANNDVDQMKLLPQLLEAIDYLITKAEELKIREKLVIVMQSEMGRTPTYNKGKGKDHWSVGSMMFLGQGIRGNRVLGATDEKQFLVPIHPKTLALDKEKGGRVRPEHVHTALRQLAGIEAHPFSKRYPLKVSAEEQLQKLWG